MITPIKKDAFRFFLYLLEHRRYSRITRIDALKCLFLAIVSSRDTDREILLNTFDNWWAMPYGPVESDIYDWIKKDPDLALRVHSEPEAHAFKDRNATLTISIENALDSLVRDLPELSKYSAFQLVELTHRFDSWKSAYNAAKTYLKNSYPMNVDEMRSEGVFARA